MGYKVSVVIPAYDERDNIPLLFEELTKILNEEYEIVFVDDGSNDGTYEAALTAAKKYERIKVLRHKRNIGKTEAIVTGFRAAEGEIIVIYDADMQFLPADILELVKRIDAGDDVCVGYKVGKYEKRFVSIIYNKLAKFIFRLPVRDINAVKALRKEVLARLKLRKDWHRYIVPLAFSLGYKISEIPVKLMPRRYGRPKYSSPLRIIIGFLDLLAVGFQLTFLKKPMLYFGTLGLISFFLGTVVGILAIVLRIFGSGFRPLLYLVILLVLSGILFFGLGLLGETISGIQERLESLEQEIRKLNFKK